MDAPHFPQEIFDMIIDLFVRDKKSLSLYSLISKSWANRTRHHLFARARLDSIDSLQIWTTTLQELSHHVRLLWLTQSQTVWITWDTLGGIFKCFRNVEFLRLKRLNLANPDERSHFESSLENLTSLTLTHSELDANALLALLCRFPKLDSLKLNNPKIIETPIYFPIPAAIPSFRGKLTLSNIEYRYGSSTIAPFVYHPHMMAFREVCIKNCRFETPRPLKDLFPACRETVKRVKINRVFMHETTETPLIDLSPLEDLEEVTLNLGSLKRPDKWIEGILTTVTSTQVHQITFDADHSSKIDSSIDLPSWSRLDEIFLAMANKLDGACKKLEVIFNVLAPGESGTVDPGRFLEKCRTKAIVRFEPGLTDWREPSGLSVGIP